MRQSTFYSGKGNYVRVESVRACKAERGREREGGEEGRKGKRTKKEIRKSVEGREREGRMVVG